MKLIKNLLLFVFLAACVNLTTTACLPWLINAYMMHRIVQTAGGYNHAMAAPRADASARTVVRPSPDLLYTVCVFDVSEHPLRITAPIQDSYVSISGFAADTRNFFAVSDADIPPDAQGKKTFNVILTRHGTPSGIPGARQVEAPSDRGIILFRSLITDDAALPVLKSDFQSKQSCTPM